MAWKQNSEFQDSQEDVARQMERRQKHGEVFAVFEVPKGNKLAISFWGQAWQHHLQGHPGYESRLPGGRSYLRQGKVYNLAIREGEVSAVVAGEALYDVILKIRPLTASRWQEVKERCAGQVGNLLDLLGGTLGDGLLKVITDPEEGLFPSPKEIKILCECADSADLCKHAAAVLYAIGLKFDAEPGLFFTLRAVNPGELLSLAADVVGQEPAQGGAPALEEADISAIFGIEMGGLPVDFDAL
ncbi:MAG: hypothetical protein JWO94_2748 [Verrucomicrobiaceae bacterium]|nr:hypothetical protein [Verrucomicrobiaceae bacterium]